MTDPKAEPRVDVLAYIDVMNDVREASRGGMTGSYGGREIVVSDLTDRLNARLVAARAAVPAEPDLAAADALSSGTVYMHDSNTMNVTVEAWNAAFLALRALSRPAPAAPLDVERLARAMRAYDTKEPVPPDFDSDAYRREARKLAAEYAAAQPEDPT